MECMKTFFSCGSVFRYMFWVGKPRFFLLKNKMCTILKQWHALMCFKWLKPNESIDEGPTEMEFVERWNAARKNKICTQVCMHGDTIGSRISHTWRSAMLFAAQHDLYPGLCQHESELPKVCIPNFTTHSFHDNTWNALYRLYLLQSTIYSIIKIWKK